MIPNSHFSFSDKITWKAAFDGKTRAFITDTSNVAISGSWASIGSSFSMIFPAKGLIYIQIMNMIWNPDGSNCHPGWGFQISSTDYSIGDFRKQNKNHSHWQTSGTSVDQILKAYGENMQVVFHGVMFDVEEFLSAHSLSEGEATVQLRSKRGSSSANTGTIKGATKRTEVVIGVLETA